MIKCKNCHQPLDSTKIDVCPYCGTLNPKSYDNYDDFDSDGVKPIGTEDGKFSKIEKKNSGDTKKFSKLKKSKYILLSFLLGFVDAHIFYIRRTSNSLIWGIGRAVFFLLALCPLIAWAITYIAVGNNDMDLMTKIDLIVMPCFVVIYNVVSGLIAIFWCRDDKIKDKKGNPLR